MRVRLLGSVDVTVDGVVRPVAGVRRRAVLAVLGLSAGRVVSVDQLIERVWPGSAPATAPNTLQRHVSHLRDVFGDRTAIVARSPGYLLDLGTEGTDVQVAERLIRDGARSADPAPGAACLRQALALWRDRPLADLADLTWFRGEADRLTQLRLTAVQALVDARLALGEHTQCVPELTGLVEQHPFHEHLHAQLMLALYRAGQPADAVAVYHRLRAALRDELGVSPDRRLSDLAAAILRQDGDLLGLPADGPPARLVPRQLPAPATGFVGRDGPLAVLDAFLAPGGGTSPTLVIGTAGVGKTALAVHWASRVREQFPDGQLYLNLRGYATSPPVPPEQALGQLLRGLGVPPERVPVEEDEAAAMYRSLLAERRVLVVLDDAASAAQVRPLLPGGPRCVALVTSRDRLGGLVASAGARCLTLDVLDPTEAAGLLVDLLGTDRAAAEPDAVTELARLCGFLPLALRIAAANLVLRPTANVAGYVAELRASNRLDALRIDGDERSAVRAAFDLSYGALMPVEQRVFRLLGLVPGPDVTVPAAAALTGETAAGVRAVLDRLVGTHLVSEPAAGRYAQHDLLRRYARSLAGCGDGPVAALAGFYRVAAGAAADLLYAGMARLPGDEARSGVPPPFDDAAGALDWLDAERANMAALVHDATRRGLHEVAWRLADNLRGYLYQRRHVVEWRQVATDALHAAGGRPLPEAAAHLSLGGVYTVTGDNDRAAEHIALALDLAERSGWKRARAAALNNLGTVDSHAGRLRRAADWFTRAARVAEECGNVMSRAIAVDNLGNVRRELGDLAEAAALHRRAIALFERTGHPLEPANALTNLAAVCRDLGELDEALRFYRRAHAMHRQTGDRERQAMCLYGIADVHRLAGRCDEAVDPARQAIALAREIGDRRTEAIAECSLAAVDCRLGRHTVAQDRYRRALALAERTRARYVRARALVGLAGAQLRSGRPEDAAATAEAGLRLCVDNGYQVVRVEALGVLAAARGRPDEPAGPARCVTPAGC